MTQEEFNKMMAEYLKTHGETATSQDAGGSSSAKEQTTAASKPDTEEKVKKEETSDKKADDSKKAKKKPEQKKTTIPPCPNLNSEQLAKAREVAPQMLEFIWKFIYQTLSPTVGFHDLIEATKPGVEIIADVVAPDVANNLLDSVLSEMNQACSGVVKEFMAQCECCDGMTCNPADKVVLVDGIVGRFPLSFVMLFSLIA